MTRRFSPPLRSAAEPRLKHHRLTIALHWTSALLMVLAAATILSREWLEEAHLRTLLVNWHREFGLFVLIALLARLGTRFRHGMADTMAGMAAPLRLAAHAAHWALYGMLLSVPMLGWALSNAHGIQLKLLGVVPLPTIVATDADLADTLTDDHILASWGILFLIVAHVGAALFHHFIRRDQVLSAMLPDRSAAGEAVDAGAGAAITGETAAG